MSEPPAGERELRALAERFSEAEARIRALVAPAPSCDRREFSRQEPAEAGSRRILVTQDLNRASLGLFRRDQQRSRCGCLEERGHENRLTGGEGSVNVAVT